MGTQGATVGHESGFVLLPGRGWPWPIVTQECVVH